MTSHLLHNQYIEFTFDQEEVTSFNFNTLKQYINEKLADEDSYNVIIFNMAVVRYIDSSGVALLINIRKKYGKEVILKNCSETIIKVIEVVGLKDEFEFI